MGPDGDEKGRDSEVRQDFMTINIKKETCCHKGKLFDSSNVFIVPEWPF